MLKRRCLCWCHNAPDWKWTDGYAGPGEGRVNGVAVTDVVAAATACSRCLKDHCAVFRTPEPDKAPKTVWIDPPAPAGYGEGPE